MSLTGLIVTETKQERDIRILTRNSDHKVSLMGLIVTENTQGRDIRLLTGNSDTKCP